MQRSLESHLFRELSPLVQLELASPHDNHWPLLGDMPWLGTIGTNDTLVPREESERFYDIAPRRLSTRSAFCLMQGAHHGFAGMPSMRTLALSDAAVCLVAAVAAGR